ncbi:hypothetical protein TVAGG3_0640030 [Trichomonas vaginalis G3]|uniref:hypothetical protein n=1 Tax=Trichomonas vaginalis (strain ATCC PRA-98 / G3) TaxID=412133 RepID=UPI0021E55E37|nr:hypothetical protein TVAGG3_0640030 [Trichomonas vaginalis G3]KAI5505096.1 hypothetical protein TVAGG3_0640030 [Trichomonas vaginalis G3]
MEMTYIRPLKFWSRSLEKIHFLASSSSNQTLQRLVRARTREGADGQQKKTNITNGILLNHRKIVWDSLHCIVLRLSQRQEINVNVHDDQNKPCLEAKKDRNKPEKKSKAKAPPKSKPKRPENPPPPVPPPENTQNQINPSIWSHVMNEYEMALEDNVSIFI